MRIDTIILSGISIVIAIISLIFAFYQGFTNMNRNKECDDKNEATQMTTVIVKLETIGTGITEIKNEIGSIKRDVKDVYERVVKNEESTRQAHNRLDLFEKLYVIGSPDDKNIKK